MKIKSITVEGFKSIYKETTITFPEKGLWKISGEVGVGKTTLGECILFCLFGSVKDINIKNLISWGAKKCISTINLESRGHDITIKRVTKLKGQGDLEILIDGSPLEYTNKRGGQQILEEDYFDVSRTAIESLCVISLNNFKSIVHLSSGSADARKFIDDVFGFNILNKYIDSTKLHLLDANSKYDEINYAIRTLESQKEKYEMQRDAINNDVDCSKIDELNDKINTNINKLADLKLSYNNEKEVYIKSRDSYLGDMNTVKERGKHTRDVINKLKNGICPLCGGKVDAKELDEYNKQLNEYLEQYKEKESLYKEVLKKISELDNDTKAKVDAIQTEIRKWQDEISKINMQQKLMANNYDKLITDLENSIFEKTSELNDADMERNTWQELYDKLYKESRPTLLRYYIPTLNKNINYYMQELQQPYNIKFDETFNCTISAYGNDNIPVSSLSVGQGKIVDTAVILGILKTLLNGVNFNVIFLDELLSNMHYELRNVMCSMLKKNIPDKLVYVITHAEMDDSIFDGMIKTKLYHWEEDDRLIQNTEYVIKK